jgi:hypothetical protein
MSRRRVVAALGAIVAALAVALVLDMSGVFGSKRSPANAAVARYIEGVDRVQEEMRLPLTRLLTAYRSFAAQNTTASAQAQLAGAERTLRTLERRLTALDAPPAAAKLRRLLLQLVQAEIGVAHEIAEFARFMPRFRVVVAGSTIASKQLARALAAAVPPKPLPARGTPTQIAKAKAAFAAAATLAADAQANAVDAYDHALAVVLRNLRTLRPPPVMVSAYRAQEQTLRATIEAGGALARELRKQHPSRVPQLSRRFGEAARLAGSVPVQRAEIAAVKAYDARVRALGTAQGKVRAEVARLQRTLG